MVSEKITKLIELAAREHGIYSSRKSASEKYNQEIAHLEEKLSRLNSDYPTPYTDELRKLNYDLFVVREIKFGAKFMGTITAASSVPALNALLFVLGKYVGVEVPFLLNIDFPAFSTYSNIAGNVALSAFLGIPIGLCAAFYSYNHFKKSKELKKQYGGDILEKVNRNAVEEAIKT